MVPQTQEMAVVVVLQGGHRQAAEVEVGAQILVVEGVLEGEVVEWHYLVAVVVEEEVLETQMEAKEGQGELDHFPCSQRSSI